MDQELTDLGGQLPKLRLGKVLQISGPADLLQHFASVRSNPPLAQHAAADQKGRTTLIASVAGAPEAWSATHCHPTPEFDMKVNIDPTAPTFATYRRDMRAEQMAEDYPS